MQEGRQYSLRSTSGNPNCRIRKRVRINVSGEMFETFEETLARYPTTLLGSRLKRSRYFDSSRCEYYFERDRTVFNAILFYYQSPGILSKPSTVSYEIFVREMKFFELDARRADRIDPSVKLNYGNSTRTSTLRGRIWQSLENPISPTERIVNTLSGLIVLFSIAVFCWETLPGVQENYHTTLQTEPPSWNDNGTTLHEETFGFVAESIFSGWFTLEYLARLITAPETLKYSLSFAAIIDVFTILPFYITLIFRPRLSDVVSFSILRLVRLVRIFKLQRYSTSIRLLFETIFDSRAELQLFLICIVFIMVLMSSAIYYAEGESNQSQFSSIPDVFWFSVVTLSSVGYGDYVPRTASGKLIGSIFCVMGVVVVFCFSPVLFAKFRKCSNRYCEELAELQIYREEMDKIYNQNEVVFDAESARKSSEEKEAQLKDR